jgi:hypothetical protein
LEALWEQQVMLMQRLAAKQLWADSEHVLLDLKILHFEGLNKVFFSKGIL